MRPHLAEAGEGASAAVQLQVSHVGEEIPLLIRVRQRRQVREGGGQPHRHAPQQRQVLLRVNENTSA